MFSSDFSDIPKLRQNSSTEKTKNIKLAGNELSAVSVVSPINCPTHPASWLHDRPVEQLCLPGHRHLEPASHTSDESQHADELAERNLLVLTRKLRHCKRDQSHRHQEPSPANCPVDATVQPFGSGPPPPNIPSSTNTASNIIRTEPAIGQKADCSYTGSGFRLVGFFFLAITGLIVPPLPLKG
jgi:hypothetical protein